MSDIVCPIRKIRKFRCRTKTRNGLKEAESEESTTAEPAAGAGGGGGATAAKGTDGI